MKTQDSIKFFGIFAVALVALTVGLVAVMGGMLTLPSPATGAIVQQQQTSEELAGAMTEIADASVCDENGRGEIRAAIYNPLNESASEYISATARLYEVVGNEEVYKGPVTLATTGLPAIGSGTTITCFDNSKNLKSYALYVPASDGNHISAKYEFQAGLDVVIDEPVPQQGGLSGKTYDNDAKGYLYEDTETSAGGWAASASTFYSTTGNSTGDSTGTTVGTSGDFDYTLTVYTAGATDVQFTDKSLMIGIDRQDKTDWQELAVGIEGTTVNIESLTCPSKISGDAYDDCYEITKGGAPLIIGSGQEKRDVSIEGNAKSGVNPTDDVKVGFFTKGYYKETAKAGMKLGYNKDDTSDTYVYTAQYFSYAFNDS